MTLKPFLSNIFTACRSFLSQLNTLITAREKHIINIALLVWILIVGVSALHHEMWRDEVRALAMALDGDNFWGLFKTLRNEGHPILWYWILRVSYWIWPTPAVLQVVSILIAYAAVMVFLKKAPFHIIVRLLFIYGVLPLVVYSVSARNYGISMLLYFLFADTFCKPQRNNLAIGIIIALLANTNFFAMMFSGILLCIWAIEEYFKQKEFKVFFRRFTLPAALALFGIALALFTISMDANSSVAPPHELLARDYLHPMLKSAQHPGRYFDQLMAAGPKMRDFVIFALIAGLLVNPLYAGSLYLSIFIYNLFSATIMTPTARHQGILFMLIVTLYWIVAMQNNKASKRYILFLAAIYLVFSPLFYHEITLAKLSITEDVSRELSSSAAFGKYINTNRQLQDAVILGDPDYILGPLIYYCKNRIYYVRENQYATYERYVKVPKEEVTLRDLLETGERIRDTEHVPVLILLQHWDIPKKENYTAIRPFGRNFRTNREEMLEFSARTIKIAEFNDAVADENFEVFLIPKSKEDWFSKYGDYQQRLAQPQP
ncbi:MAG: hypothetical protein V2B20_15115 [Pseudomonadota bacterium]